MSSDCVTTTIIYYTTKTSLLLTKTHRDTWSCRQTHTQTKHTDTHRYTHTQNDYYNLLLYMWREQINYPLNLANIDNLKMCHVWVIFHSIDI